MNVELQKLLDARAHANEVELACRAQDKENPIIFALIIQTIGVRIEARRLLFGGYAGALDAHAYVAWQAIEAGQGRPLEMAIDRVAAHLLAGLEGTAK